ncbi:DUF4238 domain-containing protein [Leptospira kanakyensis]|uniref:DUF4238 domain-containing protein n=1 Tax=Leptospira kanakyensis TaxID=2484968 RepID=UPI00223D128B|nr:DUF4238 domain-containing protein [Leptospira kanakyensis]MCW7471718.1 DUF4238 domain-containing protein [Leptospira kanakyensis]
MSEKKNQHYVPQFLLKLFSNSVNGKTIYIYNIKQNKLIKNGSIRDQCKKEYLYGKNLVIEDAFMNLEGSIASIFSHLFLNIAELNKLSLEEDINIREFILFQQLRTLGAKEEINQFTNEFAQIILKYHPQLSMHRHKFKITFENPVVENLKLAIDTLKYTLDLEIAILDAGQKEFAISDNPAFTINPFLNLRKYSGSGLGIGSVGIIILMPIHPKYCICLYDPLIYILQKKYHHFLSNEDIDKVNSIILYYTNNNIFFKSEYMFEYLQNLQKKNSTFKERKPLNQEIKKVYENGKLLKNATAFLMGKETLPFDSMLKSIPYTNSALDRPISDNMDMNREYVKKIKKEDPNFQH